MVVLTLQVIFRFKVRVCEEIFAKRGFGPFAQSEIHDSNEYEFIYVPNSISREKKKIILTSAEL